MVLSNCKIDAVSITPTYRKPFDLILARAKNEEWRALRDDFRILLETEQGLETISAARQTGA